MCNTDSALSSFSSENIEKPPKVQASDKQESFTSTDQLLPIR